MAIVYKRPSRSIPRGQRVALVSNIAAGDTVDIVDILGFPARVLKITTPDAGDVLDIRVNNKYVVAGVYNTPAQGEHGSIDPRSAVTITSGGDQHPVHTMTGSDTYYSEEGLEIAFLELVAMTPATATDVIEILAW